MAFKRVQILVLPLGDEDRDGRNWARAFELKEGLERTGLQVEAGGPVFVADQIHLLLGWRGATEAQALGFPKDCILICHASDLGPQGELSPAERILTRRFEAWELEPGWVEAPGDLSRRAVVDGASLQAALEAPRGEARWTLPHVSVILPTRDRPALLARALGSVEAQTFRDLEVIVIQDGGVDVAPVLEPFQAAGLEVRLLTTAGLGPSGARNAGLAVARGVWIAYLDDDDVQGPKHLETMLKALQGSGRAVAYGDAERVIEELREGDPTPVARLPHPSRPFDPVAILEAPPTALTNLVHARELLAQAGQFDEKLPLLEDWAFMVRLSRLGAFIHVPEATVELHFRRDGGQLALQELPRKAEAEARFNEGLAELLEAEVAALKGPAKKAPGGPEAFVFELVGASAEWRQLVRAYLGAYGADEPLALILTWDAEGAGQPGLAEVQGEILEMVLAAGLERFPGLMLVPRWEDLPSELQPFTAVRWITRLDDADLVAGPVGVPLTRALREQARIGTAPPGSAP